MPRKRRPVRPVRRPNFRPAPGPASRDVEEALEAGNGHVPPAFTEQPAVPASAGNRSRALDAQTRTSRDQRAEGRRIAQLRRSSREDRVAPRTSSTGLLPLVATGNVVKEMRQVLLTTAAMVVLLVVLALVLR